MMMVRRREELGMASASNVLTSCRMAVALILFISLVADRDHGTVEGLVHHHVRRLHVLRRYMSSSSSSDDDLLQSNPLWINQTVDHFTPEDTRMFSQRYYEYLDYFVDPKGPIFLEICGEYTCDGIYNDYYTVLAKTVGAAIVTLEHRYYGQSIPTPNLSTKNLKYLTSKQALFDLAYFRKYYQDQIIKRYNLTEDFENPWIVLGGSYPGALSAWFRLKFPHLVHGSIASSAVVNAIENYQEYSIQVGDSLGKACGDIYRNITKVLQTQLAENPYKTKSLFNATQLSDGDFAMFLSIYPSSNVQYGDPTTPCTPLLEAINNGNDILEAYAKIINDSIGGDVSSFSQEVLKSIDPSNDVGRQWFYQQCTEFGFFLTAAPWDSIFLHQLNLQYYRDTCVNVFGFGTLPTTNLTNLYYGATKIAGSRILFLNGSQDPYRHASKQTSRPSELSLTITCENCAHCVDIDGCPPYIYGGDASACASPKAVTKARAIMLNSIQHWISHEHDY